MLIEFPKQLACRGPGSRMLRPWSGTENGPFAGERFLLLVTVLSDTYPPKLIVKITRLRNFCILAERCSTVSGPRTFFGRKNAGGSCGAQHLSFKEKHILSQRGARAYRPDKPHKPEG